MKLLFSSHSLLLPVIKRLAGKFDILAIDKIMHENLNNVDIPCKSLSEFASPVLVDMAFIEAAKVLNASFSPISLDGLGSASSEFMEDGVRGFLYSRLQDLVLLILSLDESKPDLVMLHNDVESVMRVIALWCRARNVPCIHVPHAVYQDVDRGEIGTDIHDIVTANHLAASGPEQRRWYEKRGMENIRETGLPQNDRWATMKLDKKKALRLFHLDSDRPTITYMTTWHQRTNMLGVTDRANDLYLNFLKAIKTFGNEVQLIVKVHPNSFEPIVRFHLQSAEQTGINCVMTIQYLELSIQASDIVFAPYGSNTLISASYVPYTRLMSFEGHGYLKDDEVVKSGFEVEEIAKSIEEALSAPPVDMRAFNFKYAGIPDGKAYLRVAEYAEELLM